MKKIISAGFTALMLSGCMFGEKTAYVDFSQSAGRIKKELHGAGYAPGLTGAKEQQYIKDMKLTYARTHDLALVNRGQRVVDTHFVFPLEHADPADPRNYYFTATDDLLKKIIAHGMLPYYRLGSSIEHSADGHYNVHPPKDNLHYAKIFAGIIRHYNYGWANGYKMNIPYWEIWNEPNVGHLMWTGTKEQFCEFFAVVLKELKREFPNEKIGGPALTWADPKWILPLLDACKKKGVTPDFISFHTYGRETNGPAEMISDTRKMLDDAGYKNVELHLNEWHYIGFKKWSELSSQKTTRQYRDLYYSSWGMWGSDSAAYNVAMFCNFHDVPLDVSCYYGCGYGTWGFFTDEKLLNHNYYSVKMMGELVTGYPNRVKAGILRRYRGDDQEWNGQMGVSFTDDERPQGEYRARQMIAGTDASGKKGAILFADYRGMNEDVTIEIRGAKPENFDITRLDQQDKEKKVSASFKNGILTLKKDGAGSAVWLVKFDI